MNEDKNWDELVDKERKITLLPHQKLNETQVLRIRRGLLLYRLCKEWYLMQSFLSISLCCERN